MKTFVVLGVLAMIILAGCTISNNTCVDDNVCTISEQLAGNCNDCKPDFTPTDLQLSIVQSVAAAPRSIPTPTTDPVVAGNAVLDQPVPVNPSNMVTLQYQYCIKNLGGAYDGKVPVTVQVGGDYGGQPQSQDQWISFTKTALIGNIQVVQTGNGIQVFNSLQRPNDEGPIYCTGGQMQVEKSNNYFMNVRVNPDKSVAERNFDNNDAQVSIKGTPMHFPDYLIEYNVGTIQYYSSSMTTQIQWFRSGQTMYSASYTDTTLRNGFAVEVFIPNNPDEAKQYYNNLAWPVQSTPYGDVKVDISSVQHIDGIPDFRTAQIYILGNKGELITSAFMIPGVGDWQVTSHPLMVEYLKRYRGEAPPPPPSLCGTVTHTLPLRQAEITELSVNEFPALKSDTITTAQGATTYSQYLRTTSNIDSNGNTQSTNQLQQFGINYDQNRDGKLGGWLIMQQTSNPVLEWEIKFDQGLKSKRDATGNLYDLQDRTINILGTDFNIVKATVGPAGTDLDLALMSGNVVDTLREGEMKTYNVGGVDYQVTLVYVSDPTNGSAPQVKFSVNGQLTQALSKGDIDTLSGGVQIGVRDILNNAREGVASFYLGANKIEFGPIDMTTLTFKTGKVQVNNQNINEAQLRIMGSYGGDMFAISDIKYRLRMNAASGSDVYIASGHGLRENLRYPQSLISPTFDMRYGEFMYKLQDVASISYSGVDQFMLSFNNARGTPYTVPLMTNRNNVFKFGNDKNNFVYAEGNSTAHNINIGDYFVLSSNGITNVLRFEDVDPTNKVIRLTNIGNGVAIDATYTVLGNVATGTLIAGGNSYAFNLQNPTGGPYYLAVDQNGNGVIGDNSVVPIITQTGQTIQVDSAGLTAGMSLRTSGQVFGDGKSNEALTWRISPVVVNATPQLQIDNIYYNGPRVNQQNIWSEWRFTSDVSNPGVYAGMTDYGVYVGFNRGSPAAVLGFAAPLHQQVNSIMYTTCPVAAVGPAVVVQ